MSRKITSFVFVIVCIMMSTAYAVDFGSQVVVSVRDQKLAIINNGAVVAKFPISTSKYGIGDTEGSYKTPLGTLWVCYKIGDNLPQGTVIKNRSATGEIVTPNAPGRDPIVTRVIWLRGLEDQNKNAFARCIYIHGTPEEKLLGKPASYGCIRMRSKDIVAVYEVLHVGAHIVIEDKPLAKMLPEQPSKFAWLLQGMTGN